MAVLFVFFLVKYHGRVQGMFFNLPKFQDLSFISPAEGHGEDVRLALVAWGRPCGCLRESPLTSRWRGPVLGVGSSAASHVNSLSTSWKTGSKAWAQCLGFPVSPEFALGLSLPGCYLTAWPTRCLPFEARIVIPTSWQVIVRLPKMYKFLNLETGT